MAGWVAWQGPRLPFAEDRYSDLKMAMSLRQARTGERLRVRGACLLPGHSISGVQGTRPMRSHVERGYTGPPMPATQGSSSRDRNQLFHLNT
jgi:hypothetical protein